MSTRCLSEQPWTDGTNTRNNGMIHCGMAANIIFEYQHLYHVYEHCQIFSETQ